MVKALRGRHRITRGADKAYKAAEFLADLRELTVTPHVAQNTSSRRNALDGRTHTRHSATKRANASAGGLRSSSAGGSPSPPSGPAPGRPSSMLRSQTDLLPQFPN